MFTSKFYVLMPHIVQSALISFRGLMRKALREGSETRRLTEQLTKNEFSLTTLNDYSTKQLVATLQNAANNVPFYKEFCNVQQQIESYPVIDKSVLRSKFDSFHSKFKPRKIVYGATSGTTGSPLTVLQDMNSVIREQAFISRQLAWSGYKKNDKRAWIRGDLIVPLHQKEAPFWRYSWFENMIMLSSFHLTPSVMPAYIKAMVDFGVDVIQAYPSSIAMLARYLESVDSYYPSKIKSILTSSESLSDEDRLVVEKRFNCKVYDWYGLFERVAAIGQCEHGRYHLLTDYSYVELISDSESDRYEIVGTNFNNRYFPLIRYRTGDFVYLADEQGCPCKRVFPVISKIEGRVGDYLIGEDGQKVHILNHIPKGVLGLLSAQFYQNIRGVVIVKVVVDQVMFDDVQRNTLVNNVKARLGESIKVVVKIVNEIERSKNGKFRQAICEIVD